MEVGEQAVEIRGARPATRAGRWPMAVFLAVAGFVYSWMVTGYPEMPWSGRLTLTVGALSTVTLLFLSVRAGTRRLGLGNVFGLGLPRPAPECRIAIEKPEDASVRGPSMAAFLLFYAAAVSYATWMTGVWDWRTSSAGIAIAFPGAVLSGFGGWLALSAVLVHLGHGDLLGGLGFARRLFRLHAQPDEECAKAQQGNSYSDEEHQKPLHLRGPVECAPAYEAEQPGERQEADPAPQRFPDSHRNGSPPTALLQAELAFISAHREARETLR